MRRNLVCAPLFVFGSLLAVFGVSWFIAHHLFKHLLNVSSIYVCLNSPTPASYVFSTSAEVHVLVHAFGGQKSGIAVFLYLSNWSLIGPEAYSLVRLADQ